MSMLRPLLFSVVAIGAVPALAERPLVYVSDIAAAKGLEADGIALTSSLCGLLSKDKSIDVLCAPDVRQILDFAAMREVTGGNGSTAKIEARLAAATLVVSGALVSQPKGDVLLTLDVGPRAAAGDEFAPAAASSLGKVDVVTARAQVIDRLNDASTRLLAALHKPTTTAPTTTTTAPTTAAPTTTASTTTASKPAATKP